MIHLCPFVCPSCSRDGEAGQAQLVQGAVGEGLEVRCLECGEVFAVLLVSADKVPRRVEG